MAGAGARDPPVRAARGAGLRTGRARRDPRAGGHGAGGHAACPRARAAPVAGGAGAAGGRAHDSRPGRARARDGGHGALTAEDVEAFGRCISVGGVALFPADTVYGLATEPDMREGVERLYRIKGRRPDRPAAVMFFDRDLALAALPELGPRTRDALERLLPGAVTAILPNPAHRYPLACGPVPDRLGLRVPGLTGALEPLAAMRWPVLKSSANPSGGADARRLADVDERIRARVDLQLDAGELPGTPSTVVDLATYEQDGSYRVLRA